jgi:hypothetical protein
MILGEPPYSDEKSRDPNTDCCDAVFVFGSAFGLPSLALLQTGAARPTAP